MEGVGLEVRKRGVFMMGDFGEGWGKVLLVCGVFFGILGIVSEASR